MIELKKVTQKFDDYKALDNISISINEGEVVGLLGPNGAGKTTLLRLITGYLYPTSGKILINNMSFENSEILIKKSIGYMSESNALYEDMLVSELLETTADFHNINKEDRKLRIKSVVEATNIKEVYNKPISTLSKGYKQRVGISNSLVSNPDILILDEPTEGLDPNQRVEIRNLIKDLGKKRTVIVSTHVMQEVEAMCDRIIILNKGKIVVDGTKEEIIKQVKSTSTFKVVVDTNSAEKLKLDLENLSSVDSIQAIDDKSDKSSFIISVKNNDFNEEFSKVFIKSKAILFEFIQQGNSLEELFQQLTSSKLNDDKKNENKN